MSYKYFYVDCETTGLDCEKEEIVTFQYQEFNLEGNRIGELKILNIWELGEKELITQIYNLINPSNVWTFIPILINHTFDYRFFFAKFRKYDLKIGEELTYLHNHPILDLKPFLIISNNLDFKQYGLNKPNSGKVVPEYYKNKEYNKIIDYIKEETEEFFRILPFVIKYSKEARKEWQQKN